MISTVRIALAVDTGVPASVGTAASGGRDGGGTAAAVKSAEEFTSDASWRRRHSIYLLWALLPVCTFVGLVYTGIRARRWSWVAWGLLYAVLVFGTTAILPEDEDSVEYTVLSLVLLFTWIASAAHLFAHRGDWLRSKALRKAGAAPMRHANPPTPGAIRQATWGDAAPPPAPQAGPTVGPGGWADRPPPRHGLLHRSPRLRHPLRQEPAQPGGFAAGGL